MKKKVFRKRYEVVEPKKEVKKESTEKKSDK